MRKIGAAIVLASCAGILAGCAPAPQVVCDFVGGSLETLRADLPEDVDTTLVIDLSENIVGSEPTYSGTDDRDWTIVAQCSAGADWPVERPVVVGILPTSEVHEDVREHAEDGDYRSLLECEKNEKQS